MGKGDAKDVKLQCDYKRRGLLILSMVIYMVVFDSLGYLVCTVLLLIAAMKIGKVKGWKIPLVVALLTAIFFYAVFKMFMAVPLPSGFLG